MPTLSIARAIVPSFSRIHDANEVDSYWSRFLEHWSFRGKGFPGCNPRSLSRVDLPQLHRRRYLTSLKSDGVRYTLFLTTRHSTTDQPVALMIDRARNMFEVEVVAHEDHFLKGTIFEGELVWCEPARETLLYLVFDTVLCKGTSLLEQPFEERLMLAHRATSLSEELMQMPEDEMEKRALEEDTIVLSHFYPRVVLRPKKFVAMEYLTRLWNERTQSDHRVDGMIFQRSDSPYEFHTPKHASLFKWKPHSTVDLQGQECLALDGSLADTTMGRRATVLSSRIQAGGADEVVEYLIGGTESEPTLFAVRKRPDKKTPNNLRTIEATFRDALTERITIEDLRESK